MSLVKSKWLVKSDNRVLGPYTSEQIEELVSKKQISLIDEIRDMHTRWSYIREIEEFKALVEVVRNDIADKADLTQTIQTTTSQMTSVTKTINTENTATFNTSTLDFNKESVSLTEIDLTPDANESSTSIPQNATNHINPGSASVAKSVNTSSTTGAYGAMNTYSEASKTQPKKGKGLWIGLGLGICLSVASFYFFTEMKNSERNKNVVLSIQKLVNQQKKDEAIRAFNKLDSKMKEEAIIRMIPYWIALDDLKIYPIEKSFSSLHKTERVTNENLSDAELVKFNVYYKEGNYGAANQAVIKALSLQPLNEKAHENDALLYYTQKKYADASKKYKQLYDHQLKGRFLVMYLLSQISMKANKFSQYNMLVDSFLVNHVDYKKELLLLKSYFFMKMGNLSMFDRTIKEYFNYPFQVSKLFTTPQLVDSTFYKWDLLDSVQAEILSQVGDDKKPSLMLHDLVEKEKYDEALSYLEQNKTVYQEEDYYLYLVQILNLKKDSQSVKWLNEAREKGYRDSFATSVSFLILSFKSEKEVPNLGSYLSGVAHKDMIFNDWVDLATALSAGDKNKAQAILNKNIEVGTYFLPYAKARSFIDD